jgi:hypothetical protein
LLRSRASRRSARAPSTVSGSAEVARALSKPRSQVYRWLKAAGAQRLGASATADRFCSRAHGFARMAAMQHLVGRAAQARDGARELMPEGRYMLRPSERIAAQFSPLAARKMK